MRFIDEVPIQVESGTGGDGRVSFRREKFIPRGGPDGGSGGRGGHIYFATDERVNTLVHFRGRRFYQAQNGLDGHVDQMDGRNGDDLILRVPIGTLIKDKNTGETLYDLKEKDQQILVATGGNGGYGNKAFKTSTNRAPRFAQSGKEGTALELHLELKLLADLALVGLPNAGKSTLISSVSAAKPKIADYPFTTLGPNLGVVKSGDDSYVVADIPGLIENAAQGKGLGHKFLKHIERTKALVHLIDISCCIEEYEAYESYVTIRTELEKYQPELLLKKEIICLTKIDAMSDEEVEKFRKFFETQLDRKVLPISAVSGKNLEQLRRIMFSAID